MNQLNRILNLKKSVSSKSSEMADDGIKERRLHIKKDQQLDENTFAHSELQISVDKEGRMRTRSLIIIKRKPRAEEGSG